MYNDFLIKMRLSWANIVKHKWSSIVLISVFTVVSFTIFWVFGYCSHIVSLIEVINKVSYGDVTFLTGFFDKNSLKHLFQLPGIEKVVFEREVRCILDTSSGSSTTVLMLELTPDNQERLKRYIRPIRGRIPEKSDEILVSDIYQKDKHKIGDIIYVTTSTPDKAINTIDYKVVGVCKSSAFKAIGIGYFITKQGMDKLLNSSKHSNLLYFYLNEKANSKEDILAAYSMVEKILEENRIVIEDSWTITKRNEQLRIFSTVFSGLKFILLMIFFPVIGAVVAAVVWMYTTKRKKELWTYVCLGMKDYDIITLMAIEYWLTAVAGLILGFVGGFLSAFIAEAWNIWIQFSYTFSSPLLVRVTLSDIVIIVLFVMTTVFIWIQPPIKRIIKAVPFRY